MDHVCPRKVLDEHNQLRPHGACAGLPVTCPAACCSRSVMICNPILVGALCSLRRCGTGKGDVRSVLAAAQKQLQSRAGARWRVWRHHGRVPRQRWAGHVRSVKLCACVHRMLLGLLVFLFSLSEHVCTLPNCRLVHCLLETPLPAASQRGHT